MKRVSGCLNREKRSVRKEDEVVTCFRDGEDVIRFLNETELTESTLVSNQASNQVGNQARRILNDEIHDKVIEMLVYLKIPQTRADVFNYLNLTNQAKNRMRYLDPLINYGWIEMTIPNKPTSPKQKYHITETGLKLLRILKGTDAV